MADLAVESASVIGVCACLPSTVANTGLLIHASAARAGRKVEIRNFIFDDVWTAFREGRLDDYYEGIASRLGEAAREVDVLVLAQASMAPAAALCGGLRVPVLSSPRIGFEAAVQLVRAPLMRRNGS
jgi:hypothetical protein